ncbi:MAG TPA: MarR family transcriptional regulator [Steroidobacteraceae bacterium]
MQRIKLKLGAETEHIAGFLLWQVSKLWQRHLTLALHDLNLPSTQAVILANVLRLGEEGKSVTQSLLSTATKVDPMTTSQSLRSLEQKRLITRQTTKSDLRAKHVQLTQRGRDVAFEAIARLAKVHQAFFLPLKGENRQVVAYLHKLGQANDLTGPQ